MMGILRIHPTLLSCKCNSVYFFVSETRKQKLPSRSAARRAAAQTVFLLAEPQCRLLSWTRIGHNYHHYSPRSGFFLKYTCKQRILHVFFIKIMYFFLPRIRHIFFVILIFFTYRYIKNRHIFVYVILIFLFTYVNKKSPAKRKQKYVCLRVYVNKFTLFSTCVFFRIVPTFGFEFQLFKF